jgi:thymidylate kinase
VFGSLPPAGRDLDLLARPEEEQALSSGLSEHGFLRHGRIWARFEECTADVVELVAAAKWRLPAPELQALFDEALPLEGHRRLVQPAPRHFLLILARKLAAGAELDDKRRRRVDAVLEANPGSLEAAWRAAEAWGASPALTALEQALRAGGRPGPAQRGRAPLRRLRRLARAPRRGVLVTFSGLDGAGKSLQATSLQASLDRLGHPAVVEWTSLAAHPPPLEAITWGLGLLARLRRSSRAPDGGRGATPADPVKALRQRSPVVSSAWSTLVTVSNGLTHFRTASRHLWLGRHVICDRYMLDSEVHLRYAYGEARRFALQSALIRLLSPRPDRAYLLDVSGDEATRRKQEYSVEDNRRRAQLYRDHHARLGVRRIDGTRPPGEICAEIAEDVWRLLAERE